MHGPEFPGWISFPFASSDIMEVLTDMIPLLFFLPRTQMHCLELWQPFWGHEATSVRGKKTQHAAKAKETLGRTAPAITNLQTSLYGRK